jgi:4-amino-4-deoxy-L-arabinose transferase-like glycosyltransferase
MAKQQILSPCLKLSRSDSFFILALPLFTFFYLLMGIFSPQFFRHTEADRALISWAMLEDGNFTVPHLFGDKYITKPPLFYFLVSLSYRFFGTISEWSARFPSVIAATFLIFSQYIASRLLGFTRGTAALSVFILATSATFYRYSVQAEIDMVFSTFCILSCLGLSVIHFAPLSCKERTVVEKYSLFNTWKIYLLYFSTYLFLAAAILTKGPPAILFFGCTFLAIMTTSIGRHNFSLKMHSFGSLLVAALVSWWIFEFTKIVEISDLYQIIDEELLQRVTKDAGIYERNRSVFFYLTAIPLSFLPWTAVVLLITIFAFVYNLPIKKPFLTYPHLVPVLRTFALTIILGVAICSLASGKSARYVFPLFSFLSMLAAPFIIETIKPHNDTAIIWTRYLLRFTGLLLPLALVVAGVITANHDPLLLKKLNWALTGVGFFLIISASLLLCALPATASWIRILNVTLYAIFAIRGFDVLVACPVQNSIRGVKGISQELVKVIPPTEPLFVIELFERWICFYYMQNSRAVVRITPAVAARLAGDSKTVTILLNKEEEGWRVKQLQNVEPSTSVIASYFVAKKEFLLIQTRGTALQFINPRKLFPTTKTAPL